jgi:hypothetical protein
MEQYSTYIYSRGRKSDWKVQLNGLKGARSYTHYMRAVYEWRGYEDVKLFEIHKGTGGHVLEGPRRIAI